MIKLILNICIIGLPITKLMKMKLKTIEILHENHYTTESLY